MLGYSIDKWLFFFFLYSLMGWIWECTYCSIKEKRLINRGFMNGPMIPIYGCGACTMIVAALPFKGNYILTFISGMILASLLEFITGSLMEALFKVRYWDYSKNRFNIKGHVCLGASIGWGVATLVVTGVIHTYIEELANMVPEEAMYIIVRVVTVLFVVDFTLAFKTALDIRDILVKMEAMKGEVSRMMMRVDAVLAFATEEKEEPSRYDDMIKALESKLALAKEKIELSDEAKEEIALAKAKVTMMKDRISQVMPFRNLASFTIRNNPGMVSEKFKESLEELKSSIYKK